MAPRVGEWHGNEDPHVFGARVVSPDARIGKPLDAVQRFDLRLLERTFLKIESSTRSPLKSRDAVVRIGRVESDQLANPLIGLVVAIVVAQEKNVGLLRDEDSAMSHFKPGWLMQPVGERLGSVIASRCVLFGEDQQLVVQLRLWFPLGVGVHDGDPQATIAVEVQRDRIREVRNVLGRGNQVDDVTRREFELLLLLFGRKVGRLAIVRTLDVGLGFEKRQCVAVVNRVSSELALRELPNALVTIGAHLVQDGPLTFHHVDVAIGAVKAGLVPFAVDRIAVDRAITMPPVKVLVINDQF